MTRRAQTLFWIILLQALLGLIGSLFFSNILGYAPCDLCWYQRIALYPLVVIAIVALARRDTAAVWYCLPLSLIGLLIGVFHSTIYSLSNYTSQTVSIQCSVGGTSCTTPYLIMGIPVPFLSLAALAVTTVCSFLLVQELRRS